MREKYRLFRRSARLEEEPAMPIVEDADEPAPDSIADDSNVRCNARDLRENRSPDAHGVEDSDHRIVRGSKAGGLNRYGGTTRRAPNRTVVDGIFGTGVNDQPPCHLRPIGSSNAHRNSWQFAREIQLHCVAGAGVAVFERIVERNRVGREIDADYVPGKEFVAEYSGDGGRAGSAVAEVNRPEMLTCAQRMTVDLEPHRGPNRIQTHRSLPCAVELAAAAGLQSGALGFGSIDDAFAGSGIECPPASAGRIQPDREENGRAGVARERNGRNWRRRFL